MLILSHNVWFYLLVFEKNSYAAFILTLKKLFPMEKAEKYYTFILFFYFKAFQYSFVIPCRINFGLNSDLEFIFF